MPDEDGSVKRGTNEPGRVAGAGVAAIAAMLLIGGAGLLGLQSCAQAPEGQPPAGSLGQQPLQAVQPSPPPVPPPVPAPQPNPNPFPQPEPFPQPLPVPEPKPLPQPFPGPGPEPQPKPQPKPQPDPPRPMPPT